MKIDDKKWISKEARIITENWDEKNASGFKNIKSRRNDYQGAIEAQVREYFYKFDIAMKFELLRIISDRYDVSLKMTDLVFVHGDREVSLYREIPCGIVSQTGRNDLKEMTGNMFREAVADCLAIIPGAMQDFRELAEETPYLF